MLVLTPLISPYPMNPQHRSVHEILRNTENNFGKRGISRVRLWFFILKYKLVQLEYTDTKS